MSPAENYHFLPASDVKSTRFDIPQDVQQTLGFIVERLLLLHRVVEHLAKAGGGCGQGVQKRPFVEQLLAFHRAGSSDILRDGAGLPRLFHLRWCGFLRPVASVGRKPLADGWGTGVGGCCRAFFTIGQSVL